jgi:hypothetical protein
MTAVIDWLNAGASLSPAVTALPRHSFSSVMGRVAGLAALLVCVSACSVGVTKGSLLNSPLPTASPSAMEPSPSPIPKPIVTPAPQDPSPAPVKVACQGGGGTSMVLLQGSWMRQQLLYDVSDPVHPRLLCSITNTSAHLLTGAEFEWLKPISDSETDVVLSSLGPGNDTVAGTFPFRVTFGSWLPDRSVMAYSRRVPAGINDSSDSIEVWVYANQQTTALYKYPIGIGDCICRFGLPPEVLTVSPDGQYLVAGWEAGKGSPPLVVFRVSDRSMVTTLSPNVTWAFWDRTGHRLFLNRVGTLPTQTWTPEAGVVELAGATAWSYLPGLSPDGSQVSYTAYSDPNFREPRVYLYDRNFGSTRMLVDKLRTQALFVKADWVWYLDERACVPADSCAGSTMPTGKVFAMQVSTGTETPVTFAAAEDPVMQSGGVNPLAFGPGEFFPAS